MKLKLKRTACKAFKWFPENLQDSAISKYLNYKKKKLEFLTTPTAIILYVTNKCNLKCDHCFYWDSLNKNNYELSVDEISKIADSLQHSISLSLTGGEPFLRKDLSEIVDIFVKKGKAKEIGIASNGFMSDAIVSFCERFCKEHSDISLSLQISLDGMEAPHDSIRGVKGSFERAINTIDRLKKLAGLSSTFSVSAGVAVQKTNLSQMPELIDLLGKKGVEIRINLIRGETSGTFGVAKSDSSHIDPKGGDDVVLSLDEIRSLYDMLCEKNEIYGFWTKRHKRIYETCLYILEERKRALDCYAGTIDGVIYPNADVAFCELTRPVGNLRDYDFNIQKLWNSADAISMRSKVKNCFCIHGCNITTGLMFEPDIIKEAILKK